MKRALKRSHKRRSHIGMVGAIDPLDSCDKFSSPNKVHRANNIDSNASRPRCSLEHLNRSPWLSLSAASQPQTKRNHGICQGVAHGGQCQQQSMPAEITAWSRLPNSASMGKGEGIWVFLFWQTPQDGGSFKPTKYRVPWYPPRITHSFIDCCETLLIHSVHV